MASRKVHTPCALLKAAFSWRSSRPLTLTSSALKPMLLSHDSLHQYRIFRFSTKLWAIFSTSSRKEEGEGEPARHLDVNLTPLIRIDVHSVRRIPVPDLFEDALLIECRIQCARALAQT